MNSATILRAMKITEPVTMLTDYALGVANLFFAMSTYNGINPKNRVTGLLLLLGFLSQAMSGFAGGTFHGFASYFEGSQRQSVWNLTLLSIGATLGFLASAIHAAEVHRIHGQWIVAGVVLGLVGLGIQMTRFREHRPFNHNDVFHIVLIVAMFLFFRGARHLLDRAYSPR
jgi:hypothetical protein